MDLEKTSNKELFKLVKNYCVSNGSSIIHINANDYVVTIHHEYFYQEFCLINDLLFIKSNNVLIGINSINELMQCLDFSFIKETVLPFDMAIKCDLIINYDKS